MCSVLKVTGCVGHRMGVGEITAMEDPLVFSMSNLRDIVDRFVSGFLYGSIHALSCAKKETVVCGVYVWSSDGSTYNIFVALV